jgi:predicted porin
MKHRKTQLAAAVGAALMVGGTAAQAQAVAASQPLSVTLYGQVHRALMWADDGIQNKIFHVDGQSSSTRFGIRGVADLAPGLRGGFTFENEMRSNRSDGVRFGAEVSDPSLGERWLDAFFEGAWGRINIGQGSGAADDVSTIDLSGTAQVLGLGMGDWGGGVRWRTPAGGTTTVAGAVGATTLGSVVDNQDFFSRYDRAMYTTPVFGGLRAQAGFGYRGGPESTTTLQNVAHDIREASIWWAGKLAGDLQAAIGWGEEDAPAAAEFPGAGKHEVIGGSASWLAAFGLSVTVAYTQAKNRVSQANTRQPDNFLGKSKHTWGKIGYKFGQHAIGFSYGIGEDQALAGDEATSWGIGYQWAPTRWADIYVGYNLYELDRPGVALEDIQVARIGTRLRF